MRNKIKDKQMQREKHARHINILGIMRNGGFAVNSNMLQMKRYNLLHTFLVMRMLQTIGQKWRNFLVVNASGISTEFPFPGNMGRVTIENGIGERRVFIQHRNIFLWRDIENDPIRRHSQPDHPFEVVQRGRIIAERGRRVPLPRLRLRLPYLA